MNIYDHSKKILTFFQWIIKWIKGNYRLIRFLRFFHIPLKPLSTFSSIYAFTLADYSELFPDQIIIFFRQPTIKNRFENAVNAVGFEDLEKDIISSLDNNLVVSEIPFEVDFSEIIRPFIDCFKKNFDLAEDIFAKNNTIEINKLKKALLKESPNNSTLSQVIYSTEYRLTNPKIIPPLPEYYISRNDIENNIVSEIVNSTLNHNQPVKKCYAIVGSGGVGKSTLLFSLIRNEKIRSKFPRILNFTFSEFSNSNPIDLLADFYHSLSGKINTDFTKEEYIACIRSLLSEQDTLLVLDDVDSPEEIEDFFSCRVDNCVLLLTTRNIDIPYRFGIIQPFELFGFSELEVTQLQQGYFQSKYVNSEQNSKIITLANLVDFNPLALSIIFASILLGDYSWDEIINDITNAIYTNSLEYPNPKNKNQSVELSIEYSLKHLTEFEREFISFLSIFPRGITFFIEDASMLLNSIIDTKRKKKEENSSNDDVRIQCKKLLQNFYKRGLIIRLTHQDSELYKLHSLLIDNGLRFLKKTNNLEKAILVHLNIYFRLLITDNSSIEVTSTMRFILPQIEVILYRIFNRINNQLFLVIPDAFIDIILTPIIEKLIPYLIKNGRYTHSEYWLERLVNLPKNDRFSDIRKYSYEQLEFLYLKTGNTELARDANQKLNLLFKQGDSSDVIKQKFQMINILLAEKNYKLASKQLAQIDESTIKEDYILGRYYSTKSKTLMALEKWDEAIIFINKSIEIAEKEQDIQNLAKRIGNKCIYYGFKEISDFHTSVKYACQSIYYGQVCGDITVVINRYMNLFQLSIRHKKVFLSKFFILCAKHYSTYTSGASVLELIDRFLESISKVYKKIKFEELLPELFEFTFLYKTNNSCFDFNIFVLMVKLIPKNVVESKIIDRLLMLCKERYNFGKIIENIPHPVNSNFVVLILCIENPEFNNVIPQILHQFALYIINNAQPDFSGIPKDVLAIQPENHEKEVLRNDLLFLCSLTYPKRNIQYSDIRSGINHRYVITFFETIYRKDRLLKRHRHKK